MTVWPFGARSEATQAREAGKRLVADPPRRNDRWSKYRSVLRCVSPILRRVQEQLYLSSKIMRFPSNESNDSSPCHRPRFGVVDSRYFIKDTIIVSSSPDFV
ncbi:hypothetical protein M378DRAFT_164027 [Amanita muscaria Koide BX008]|uniref:Uncharacterized protein n=1 Tax=Amanita muscaria (strain Koide BX008) TaxID=946122 RepID=A0A0C2X3P0_AMAMK|nr:hypothetical protein M378DRAFT_164027 [Amanita muscaria Koide BX008]